MQFAHIQATSASGVAYSKTGSLSRPKNRVDEGATTLEVTSALSRRSRAGTYGLRRPGKGRKTLEKQALQVFRAYPGFPAVSRRDVRQVCAKNALAGVRRREVPDPGTGPKDQVPL